MALLISFDGPHLGMRQDRLLKKYSEQILIAKIFDFVESVEERLHDEFSWVFRRNASFRSHLDDDDFFDNMDGNVFSIGTVRWYMLVKDPEGNVIHKNWLIAFCEEYGDFLAARHREGVVRNFADTGVVLQKGKLANVMDAMIEHQRIRRFRINRNS